ncbi:MBL fold metallo-hydrolase [Paraburkholderia metrosideri]|uniref:MBL fold metallo-hydrolase n=1 Tax=Paraburkholderia metrosideri TaxID=580937 RepID=A0ABW9DZB3_9BURK
MSHFTFSKGLHDLGNGHYAYLQPNGGWGYSNAGLVVDGEESLLVDTLFDERLTAEMFATMKKATGIGGDEISTLVNTHANGDHTFGNRLARNATIIASASSIHEMSEEGSSPELLATLMRNPDQFGPAGAFVAKIFRGFDFAGVKLRLPDRSFSGQEVLKVGDKEVRLIEVGPAHTQGDTLVHVPRDKVIYTGDILFIEGTPIIWSGPVSNWIKACDLICAMDVEVIVPGHGPITDKAGVRKMRDYLIFIDQETRKRHAAGMDSWEAAQDIALAHFAEWPDPERLVVNVDTLYRELNADDTSSRDMLGLFGRMGMLNKRYETARACRCDGHHHP